MFEEKNMYFSFTLDISNWKLILSVQEQYKVKMMLYSVMKLISIKWIEFCEKYRLIDYHLSKDYGGARGVVVIVVGNGHGDTSSNPGRD